MSPLLQYSMFFQNVCVYFAKQHKRIHIILQNWKQMFLRVLLKENILF